MEIGKKELLDNKDVENVNNKNEQCVKKHMFLISQSEEIKGYPCVFESINPLSETYDIWNNLVLDNYKNEDEWLDKISETIGEDGELVELHCYDGMPSYEFLNKPLFKNLSSLYLYEATKLTDLSFLFNMKCLSALLIDGAEKLAETNQLKDLIAFLKMQERELEKYLELPLDERKKDIFFFPYLSALGIRGAGIKDLSMFSELKRALSEINFAYNEIEDIMPLKGLVSSYLFLEHNKISRGFAEVVGSMGYPVDINVRHNKIDDEELKRMLEMNSERDLIHLYIHHNLITDYSGLANKHLSRTDVTREEMKIEWE